MYSIEKSKLKEEFHFDWIDDLEWNKEKEIIFNTSYRIHICICEQSSKYVWVKILLRKQSVVKKTK